MAEISWIRLRIDMFDDEKIKIIQSMPEGDSILVIWIRLLALAGKCNSNGLVLVEDEFPYSDEMLSIIFNKPLTVVRMALNTFEKFKMIEQTTKGIYISNFEKHQNSDGMAAIREQNRIRKQRERERKKALLLEEQQTSGALPCFDEEPTEEGCHVTCHVTECDNSREVTQQRENKNKNIDIYNISSNEDIVEIENSDTGDPPKKEPGKQEQRLSYDVIMNDYHATCPDLPSIRAMSDARKKKIKTLVNELERMKVFPGLTPYELLHKIFEAAQLSDFLSGRNGKWNGCSFDWLINKTNALKILEGNYTNKGGAPGGRNYSGHNETNVPGSDGTTNEALARFRRNSGAGV